MKAAKETRITWDNLGDIRVMKANGWIRAILYREGGWWWTGIFDTPGETQLGFTPTLREAMREAISHYEAWRIPADSPRGE